MRDVSASLLHTVDWIKFTHVTQYAYDLYFNFNHARKSLLIYFAINNKECQNIQSRHMQSVSSVWEVRFYRFSCGDEKKTSGFRMHY